VTTHAEIAHERHRRAVRFFWALLIGATLLSLTGNVISAVLPYVPHVAVQIGAAAVPPIALLAAVHGIALAVSAGASGRVYCWAVGAVSAIGTGAFAVSFLALRDLMKAIGYSPATACIFPLIIDAAVAVATVMLVALGDKPARRVRIGKSSADTNSPTLAGLPRRLVQSAKVNVSESALCSTEVPGSVSLQRNPAHVAQGSVQAQTTQADTDLALELIASGVTTQAVDTVVAVLEAHRNGASINGAARASAINFRTAKRIVEAAAEQRHLQLAAVG
jgi:hypothetical protein